MCARTKKSIVHRQYLHWPCTDLPEISEDIFHPKKEDDLFQKMKTTSPKNYEKLTQKLKLTSNNEDETKI